MSDIPFHIPDGLEEIRHELPAFVDLLARTAKWVHPDAFRALPVWYPETARGHQDFGSRWIERRINKKRGTEVKEANIKAGKALTGALGTKKVRNWTVCHIWGTDDPTFQKRNDVVKDPRFYSCVGNMIWLPTPLKGFTDAVPEVKRMLRVCAYYTYGWVCEHESVKVDANLVASGEIPKGYPDGWPRQLDQSPPPGTAPFSKRVRASIENRKRRLRLELGDQKLSSYPHDDVRAVLDFWKITL